MVLVRMELVSLQRVKFAARGLKIIVPGRPMHANYHVQDVDWLSAEPLVGS